MAPTTNDDRTDLPPEGLAPPEGRLLVFVQGAVASHTLPDEGTLLVGRSDACDVQIPHASISRQHARLHVGATLLVEDLKSSFGTRIAGARVEPGRLTQVVPGVALELGSVMILYQPGSSKRAAEGASHAIGTRAAGAPALSYWERIAPLVELVSKSALSVIILGETGVGKDVMATTLVQRSARADRPFLRINCAALPEGLLEAELFGYERGAFTGATQAKPGLLEAASGGTVLLDEIAEMPLAAQAKLLRVIESRDVMRLGSLEARPIDVRFLAATNKNLGTLVAEGRFREDLLHRLNGMSLVIPPLRERLSEIPALARGFVEDVCRKLGKAPPAIAEESLGLLAGHPWRGNVRELRNVMERAAVLCEGGPILPPHLMLTQPALESGWEPMHAPLPTLPPPPVPDADPMPPSSQLPEEIQALERRRIVEALERAGGNQTKAAQLLGISRRTLLRRLDQFALIRPRKP